MEKQQNTRPKLSTAHGIDREIIMHGLSNQEIERIIGAPLPKTRPGHLAYQQLTHEQEAAIRKYMAEHPSRYEDDDLMEP